MSDTVTLGPHEAAFAVRELLRPVTVMPTHVNEAATSGGGVQSGTRVERFISNLASSADVVVPISDVARAFDGSGRCIGCR